LAQDPLPYALHIHLLCTNMLSSLFIVVALLPNLVASTAVAIQKHQAAQPMVKTDDLPWYVKVSFSHFASLYTEDVQGPHLLATVANSTAEYILIDFYAPWCPHCRHFAPEFERLSLAMKRLHEKHVRAAKQPPKILTGTVDCVMFAATCKQWNVTGYPTLRWGKRSDWLAMDAVRNLAKVETKDPLDAESVAGWINTKLSSEGFSPEIDPSHIPRKSLFPMPANVVVLSATGHAQQARADVWDAQLAAALFLRDMLGDTLSGDKKAVMLDFVDLLKTKFPEVDGQSQCRKSFETLSTLLRANGTQAPIRIDPDTLEKTWQPCSVPYNEYAHGFRMCRGTWPGRRGMTCGLWTLIHMLAAQSDDASATKTFQTLHDLIDKFFTCKECRENFLKTPTPSRAKTLTRRDLQLWWWNAHNIVNRRVMEIEAKFEDADPGYPKVAWFPSRVVCPTCHGTSSTGSAFISASGSAFMKTWKINEPASIEDAKLHEGFDLVEVGSFLDTFYGAQSNSPKSTKVD